MNKCVTASMNSTDSLLFHPCVNYSGHAGTGSSLVVKGRRSFLLLLIPPPPTVSALGYFCPRSFGLFGMLGTL